MVYHFGFTQFSEVENKKMYSDADGPFGLPPPPARSYPPPNGPGDQFEHQRRYPPPFGAASVNRDLTSSAQLVGISQYNTILKKQMFFGFNCSLLSRYFL